jgi:hypothetical protein
MSDSAKPEDYRFNDPRRLPRHSGAAIARGHFK